MKVFKLSSIVVSFMCSCCMLWAADRQQSLLQQYETHFNYYPAVDTLYSDSIYVQELGCFQPYDLDVFVDRFITLGDSLTADEAEYILYTIIYKVDNEIGLAILDSLENQAIRLNNDRLAFETEFMRLVHRNKDGIISPKPFVREVSAFVAKAEKRGDDFRKVTALSYLLHRLWHDGAPDYPAFFKNAQLVADQLDDPRYDQYMKKRYAYNLIGDAYYAFHDYAKAIPYLKKALSEDVTRFYDRSNLKSLNTLSMCYDDMGNIDSALYYDRRMLESKDQVLMRPMYDVIAVSNTGHTYAEMKRYDEAIPYLEAGLKGALEEGDFSFATGIYIGLGECFLGKGDLRKTEAMLDSAKVYLLAYDYVASRYRTYYKLLSKYYATTGKAELAIAYMDSTLDETKKYIERYSALNIVKAEQELFQATREAQANRIKRQKQVLTVSLTIMAITFLMLIALCLFCLRKRAAYKRLLSKNEQWMDGYQEQEGGLPMDELNRRRTQKAILLLSDSGYDHLYEEEIARKAGFPDKKSFRNIFEKETGMSPTNFKKNRTSKM